MKFTPVTPELQRAVEKAMGHFKTQKNFCKRAGVSTRWMTSVRHGRVGFVNEEQVRLVLAFQRKVNPDGLEWLSKKELAERDLYTVTKGRKEKFKKIDGKWHKLCSGPYHENPAWIPTTNFNKASTKAGVFRSWCKSCDAFNHGSEQMVDATPYMVMVTELVNRLGVHEACRQIGVSQQAMYQWRNKGMRKIKRKNARKITQALVHVRKNNIVRHRDSIHHGAHLRGHKEKIPKRRRDLYKSHGDIDNETKRRLRPAITA